MNDKLDRFVNLMRGIFELDKSDLDFGIYRIMNIRKAEIEKFLSEGLPAKITETLAPFAQTDTEDLKKQIESIEKQAADFGIADISASPMAEKYNSLKAQLAGGTDLSALESDVYSALYNFFNRYYDEGDFISKRRYKEGVYAIPYEGEEVKLYWANQDQYYIKTSENFKDYTFKVDDYSVHFRIVDATTEQNNNKESDDSKRVFMLFTEDEENFPGIKTFEHNADTKEIIVRFIYEIQTKYTGKADVIVKKWTEDNFESIKEWLVNEQIPTWDILLKSIEHKKDKKYCLLKKHLNAYVAKNTFDYFIHKDLKGFLTRELDFYIKSEIMHLDDLDTSNEQRVETYLAKVKAVKRVGAIIIDFLAQIENFQKKLWLKKKFVIETNWCITLDRIDEKFYPEIIENKAQIQEWIDMYAVDEIKEDLTTVGFTNPPTVEFLRQNLNLVVDTKHFTNDFKERLIASIDNLDEETGGLMINSDNYQAIRLIDNKYKNTIDCYYIDPPYNTGNDKFIYKDGYPHSSWLSMMNDRLNLSIDLMKTTSSIFIHIDEHEIALLTKLCNDIYSQSNELGTIVWDKRNPKGVVAGVAYQHEYIIAFAKNKDQFSLIPFTKKKKNAVSMIEYVKSLIKKYGSVNENVRTEYKKWIKDNEDNLSGGEKAYNLIDDNGRIYQPVSMAAPDKPETRSHRPLIHPITCKECPVPAKGWRYTNDSMDELIANDKIAFGTDETTQPRQKYFLDENMEEAFSSLIYYGGSGDTLGYNFENSKPVYVAEKELLTDVEQVLQFIDDFVKNKDKTIKRINALINEDTGLTDSAGNELFYQDFNGINTIFGTSISAEMVYEDIMRCIFNSDSVPDQPRLHIVNLKQIDGEIALKIGEYNDYFGVISVGDTAALVKKCADDGMVTDTEAFYSDSLFSSINSKDSDINILVGSRKFSEGWNSWRVSTMGLINFGHTEGSQAIQLFGRGVRLRGYEGCLKRSSKVDKKINVPEMLRWLETLTIFGIKAQYMEDFKKYLEMEDLSTNETVHEFKLPILSRFNDIKDKKLQVIQLPKDKVFKKQAKRMILTAPDDGFFTYLNKHKIVVDCRSKVQTIESNLSLHFESTTKEHTLDKKILPYLNYSRVYEELQRYKNEKLYYNITIDKSLLKDIMEYDGWYSLIIPKTHIQIDSVMKLEDATDYAIMVLKIYMDKFFVYNKEKWEEPYMSYFELDGSNNNFESEYTIRYTNINDNDTQAEAIKAFIADVTDTLEKNKCIPGYSMATNHDIITAFDFKNHLYAPLVHLNAGSLKIQVSPVQMNDGEMKFVGLLKDYLEKNPDVLGEKELYLLRNKSKVGMGFFEAGNFYPDFILWIKEQGLQRISFIDPKGLLKLMPNDPKIEFHKTIKELQARLQDKLENEKVILNSFIMSITPSQSLKEWWMMSKPEREAKNVLCLDNDDCIEVMLKNILNDTI